MNASEPYQMIEGFLFLPLSMGCFDEMPETVEVLGTTLYKKDEFHVTLLNTNRLSSALDTSPEVLLDLFKEFSKSNVTVFDGWIDDFRYVEDLARGRASVVVRCRVEGLTELYEYLGEHFGTTLPVQPAHVTLYTLRNGLGIGINTSAEMEALQQVFVPDVVLR